MPDDLLQRIYAAFDPLPLTADQKDLYVELDELRGDADVVKRMMAKIRLANGKPTCQVLAGHKGSGKSTELYRLKFHLEEGPPKMFVVFCEADEDLDRNDVDFPDLLVVIVRQMAQQIQDRAGIQLAPGYFKDRLQRLGNLLTSEINFDKFDLQVGLAKLGITLKGSPDARLAIRKAMEPDTGNLLHAANDVISQAVLELRKKDYHGLVIIVDDLDKMIVRPIETGCSSAEHLFVNRAAQLTAFACHLVYTIPISLAYSHQENAIKASYGGHVPVIPMTKTATPPPQSRPYDPGVAKFREIITKRLTKAGATEADLFVNDAVREKLIHLSGGQPTELMTLVREAIVTQDLPVRAQSLARAEREGQREYARQLRGEHWPIIEAVGKTGHFVPTAENERLFRELLEGRSVLVYENGDEWYGLNPMVAALEAPAGQKPARRPKRR